MGRLGQVSRFKYFGWVGNIIYGGINAALKMQILLEHINKILPWFQRIFVILRAAFKALLSIEED